MNEIVRPMYGTVVSLDICKSTKIFEKIVQNKNDNDNDNSTANFQIQLKFYLSCSE